MGEHMESEMDAYIEKGEAMHDKVEELENKVKAMRLVLKKLEWWEYQAWCPICDGIIDDGHTEDCELAKVLEE